MGRFHREPFEECWAGLVDLEGHSGERKGTMTMGGGGAAFLLGRHSGVELDLAANFVQVRRLHFYVGIIVKKISY